MKKVKIEEVENFTINKKGQIFKGEEKKPCKETSNGDVVVELEKDGNKQVIKLNPKELVAKYFHVKEKSTRKPRNVDRYEKVKELFNQGKSRKEIKDELQLKSIGFYIKKIKSEQQGK